MLTNVTVFQFLDDFFESLSVNFVVNTELGAHEMVAKFQKLNTVDAIAIKELKVGLNPRVVPL